MSVNAEENVQWTRKDIRDLRVAILNDALVEIGTLFGLYADKHSRPSKKARELIAWMGDDSTEQPFGFVACCKAAGVDPDALRCAYGLLCVKSRKALH